MAGVVMWGDKGGQAGGGWPALCALEGVGHAGMLNDHGELKRRVNFWKVFSLQSTPEVFQVQGRECGCRAAPAHPCPGVHIPIRLVLLHGTGVPRPPGAQPRAAPSATRAITAPPWGSGDAAAAVDGPILILGSNRAMFIILIG